jgi:AraC-like DNA-binding protein
MGWMTTLANWRSAWVARQELALLDAEELRRLGHDVGLSADQLTRLTAHGAKGSGELMRGLGLAPERTERIHADVMRDMSIICSGCSYQSQFSPVLKAQVKGESQFADLIRWMQSNLDAPLDVPSLAARAGLSERTFHRKFVAATGETPARFVEIARLDAARMLLSRGLSLEQVGCSHPRAWRKPSSAASASRRDCSATCTRNCER